MRRIPGLRAIVRRLDRRGQYSNVRSLGRILGFFVLETDASSRDDNVPETPELSRFRRYETATSVATPALDRLLGCVRELEPSIQSTLRAAERERRLAPPVSDALRDAGVFSCIFRPASRDALELDPITAFRVFEELSRIDSAVGWNVTLANACEVFGAWYSDRVTEEVFGSPETVMAGSELPRKAVPADGGYRISGRTLFSSNCRSATWILGLANVFDGDDMRVDERGAAVTLLTLFPMRRPRSGTTGIPGHVRHGKR